VLADDCPNREQEDSRRQRAKGKAETISAHQPPNNTNMLLTLIRHGETEHNKGQLTLGRADVPLNARGLLQARSVAASVARPPADIYSSPLARCLETANLIGASANVSVTVDPGLIEMDVGEMEHLSREELRERYPDFLREWLAAPGEARMPGGETLAEVQERAWAAVERMQVGHPEGEVIAVTHNFVILTIACHVLNLPLSDFRRLRTTLAGITTVQLSAEMSSGTPTLISWNDTGHLRTRGLA
jgi:broad specificity phosphatase PhoE